MKEFIEKLIGRLEEHEEYENDNGNYYAMRAYVYAKEIVNELAEEYRDDKVHQIAMMYAKSIYLYGVDITEKWETAVQNHMALEQAYMRGRQDERDRFAEWQEEYANNIDVPTIDAGELFGKTVNDGWIPYTDKSYPKVGRIIDVWLTLEDGVYKAVWNGSDFEWENGRAITDKIFAWMDNSVPKPYQPKGE